MDGVAKSWGPNISPLISPGKYALIERLQKEIDRALSAVLGDTSRFCIFDFPDHNNVGDSAIFIGELAYLSSFRKSTPEYVCRADQCDYKRLETYYDQALILMHGGGNFGDLWPWHHSRREALLERFRGRRIVQLPQTIKFKSEAALSRTREVISRHGNFVLMVRDWNSFDFAKRHFECTVVLCPDMALSLGALERRLVPRMPKQILLLLRNDLERAAQIGTLPTHLAEGVLVDDWRMDSKPVRAIRKMFALGETVLKTPSAIQSGDQLRLNYFRSLATRRVQRGLRLLNSADVVVSDRLHAYLLTTLLDIPAVVIDNSYGKVGSFIETWLNAEERDPIVTTIKDGLAAAELKLEASAKAP